MTIFASSKKAWTSRSTRPTRTRLPLWLCSTPKTRLIQYLHCHPEERLAPNLRETTKAEDLGKLPAKADPTDLASALLQKGGA